MARSDSVAKRIKKHIDNLNSPNKDIAVRAEGYLIRYYGAAATDQLAEACLHSNPLVRLRAAWILGHTRDPKAYEPILQLTKDPDRRVRYDAVIALGILGDPRAVEPLLKLLNVRDQEGSLDAAAGEGLERMGEVGIQALIGVLKIGSSSARLIAAQTLGSRGEERAIGPLYNLIGSSDKLLRIAGIEALGMIGEKTQTERCLQLISNHLDDPNPEVREITQYWHNELKSLQ